jgi:uncharacterized protein YxjI
MGWRDRPSRRNPDQDADVPEGPARRYRLRESLPSVGDGYWIEDPSGQKAYRVNGSELHRHTAVELEDAAGQPLCTIRSSHRHRQDSMSVELPDGSRLATIHQALVSPFQKRWRVDVDSGEQLSVQGNIVDHEYTVEENGKRLAMVSKRWFRSRDAYGVQIAAGSDPPLVLAVAVALDVMNPGG